MPSTCARTGGSPAGRSTFPPGAAARLQQEAAAIVAAGAVGFGELTVEHFSSGRGGHSYESTRADHPLLLALADVAAQNAMPIDLHMEAVPRDMDMPTRMRGRGENPERLRENIWLTSTISTRRH
ncbi:MAG TPA: hypothetical protein VHO73_00610 [Methylomirabilota bacterium]|nr:hypothetical protein [Methylomirabilota bacterium]